MTKRFTDTDLWQKAWFQELSLTHKILLKYIFENCDCAGMWNANFRMASFIIGENVSLDDLKEINAKKEQFEILPNGNIFVIDFIKFQYGTLSENCKPHKPIIEKLKNYGIYERVLKGFSKGINTLEEKEKEKEKEKDKDKEQEIEKEEKTKIDVFINPYKQKFLDCFKETFGKYPRLGREESEKIVELAADNKDFLEVIPNVVSKIHEINWDIGFKPNANWLLKDNNFYRVLNGEFDKQEDDFNDFLNEYRKEKEDALIT